MTLAESQFALAALASLCAGERESVEILRFRGQTPGRGCFRRRARHARARLAPSRSLNASRQSRLAHERAESEARSTRAQRAC